MRVISYVAALAILGIVAALAHIAQAGPQSPCYWAGTFVRCLPSAGIEVQDARAIRWYEGVAGGSNYAAVKAPATLAGDYTLTLPVDDGNANQVLATDGSGVLSWASAATVPATGTVYSDGSALQTAGNGTASQWLIAGSSSAPSWSDTTTRAKTITTDDSATTTALTLATLDHSSSGTPAAGFGSALKFTAESTTTLARDQAAIQSRWTTATDASRASALDFQTLTAAGSLTTQMTVFGDGSVGVGATAPVARVHVKGSGTSGQVTSSMILENTSSGTLGLDINGSGGSSFARFMYGGGPSTGTNAMTGEAMRIGLEGANAGVVSAGTVSIGPTSTGASAVQKVINSSLEVTAKSANGAAVSGAINPGTDNSANAPITLTNGQSFTITVTGGYYWLVIVNDGGGTTGAILSMNQASATVNSINTTGTVALTDAGASLRVFKSSSSQVFTIKNSTGGTGTYKVGVIGATITAISNPA